MAGGGVTGSAFVTGLNRLWDPSLKRPEITVFERENWEASIHEVYENGLLISEIMSDWSFSLKIGRMNG